jgi:hypothetical protein
LNYNIPNKGRQIHTFSSSSSTALAISFFCSKVESRSNFGTLALITEQNKEFYEFWKVHCKNV